MKAKSQEKIEDLVLQRIEEALKKAGNVNRLALRLGTSFAVVQNWRRQERFPSLEYIRRIDEYLMGQAA